MLVFVKDHSGLVATLKLKIGQVGLRRFERISEKLVDDLPEEHH
jgi:hypothetical protein